jgi:arylformamidase
MRIYDVTVPLDRRVPIFPGDPEFRLDVMASLAGGAVCNLSRMDCGVHTGTHVDAPVHFIPPGRYELTCLPIRLVGADGAPARVVLRSQE